MEDGGVRLLKQLLLYVTQAQLMRIAIPIFLIAVSFLLYFSIQPAKNLLNETATHNLQDDILKIDKGNNTNINISKLVERYIPKAMKKNVALNLLAEQGFQIKPYHKKYLSKLENIDEAYVATWVFHKGYFSNHEANISIFITNKNVNYIIANINYILI